MNFVQKRNLFAMILLVCVLLMTACGDATDGPRGTFVQSEDEKTGYELVLQAGGKGTVSFFSSVDGETEESIFYTWDGDVLTVHGKGGAVIGGGEYQGKATFHEDGSVSVELKSVDTGMPLGMGEFICQAPTN